MAKIESYDDLTLTSKYCINCKCIVEPDEALNCPECGGNIPLMRHKAEKEAQAAVERIQNKKPKNKTDITDIIDEAIDENPHLGKYIRAITAEDVDFQKIKYSDKDGIEIHYNKFVEGGIKKVIFECKETPHPDFEVVLKELKPEVLYILELPEEYDTNMEIRGCSLGQGAVITAVKKFEWLGNKAFCINTPHLMFERNVDKNDPNQIPLPKRTEILINKLIEEAVQYLNGKRKNQQGRLKLVS